MIKPGLNKLFAIVLIAGAAISASAADFQIHDGDRVVFLGDSITEQRLYTTYIEAYALTRHPNWHLVFRNVGWGGDTSWLRQRAHPDEKQLFSADDATQEKMVEGSVGKGLERDVLPLKPTFVTVKFGMNDHSYQPFREDIFKAYVKSQTQIAKVLESHGARVAFLTPQPIEDKRADPDKDARNISLRKFSDGLKEVASKTDSVFVDQFDPYMAMLVRERASNPPNFIGGGDAVHPGPIGHTVMAWAVLKGLGAPALVSSATIDLNGQKVTSSEACRITQLKCFQGGSLDFERLDEALPMPVDSRAEPALKLAPVLADLDLCELRVTALPAGTYEVKIDGEVAGKVNSDELAAGWNMANAPGPIQKQSRDLLKLVFEKNELFFNRWRNIQLYGFPAWAEGPEIESARKKAIAKLDRQIEEKEADIEKVRQPRPHHFEIKMASQ